MFVFLAGNMSEGYQAYGPYDDIGFALDIHEFEEGWVMELHRHPNNRSDES
jgi:hypothetical protein